MTTPKQIAANRRNARRHGLLSTQIVLPDEDADAFAVFAARMIGALGPEGPLEALLVDRITASAWRLGRAVRLEAGVLAVRTADAQRALTDAGQTGDALATGVIRDATGADALTKLGRYERTLERGFYRALHELERRQAARRGAPVVPPAVVDVTVDVSAEEN